MKIRKLIIENFRGLSHIECNFDKPTNIIVGPNAVGKTTILEAVRLAKALLMPRYIQEGQQVLVSLGVTSPHPQLSSYLDFSALAREPSEPVKVSMNIELSKREVDYLTSAEEQITFELLRGQFAGSDDQGHLALTLYLSSEEGKARRNTVQKSVTEKLESLHTHNSLSIQLTIENRKGLVGDSDPFNHALVMILERNCPPHQSLFSYFPADRAFPAGEVNIQIGSGEASNQIQSHIGQAPSKYQRLKQTIVNNLLLSGTDQSNLREDFQQVFEKLLPGKELAGLSLSPVGTLRVLIREIATGKVFDIDSMSSGEKGLILTFILLRRTLSEGGIALLDEPELHLNPAVCKNIIPFLSDSIIARSDLQVLVCTHSAEILGAAFDHPDCTIHHLRTHKDATKIYEQDSREVFDALRRLGTTAAESLFSRGNLFVEGDHDSAILEEGFGEQVSGFRITCLGGRKEVEKEIAALQEGERRGELDKLNGFIFDLDRSPETIERTELVRVLQWDRYCLENYLIGKKLLFDVLTENGVGNLGSRGTFESRLVELALGQLNEVIAKEVYASLEPENPGLRPRELAHKSYPEIATVLADRLTNIGTALGGFEPEKWKSDFDFKCGILHNERLNTWKDDWTRVCSGKRLIDDLYEEYSIRISKFNFKRLLARRMKFDQTEDWTLVKSKIRDALGV